MRTCDVLASSGHSHLAAKLFPFSFWDGSLFAKLTININYLFIDTRSKTGKWNINAVGLVLKMATSKVELLAARAAILPVDFAQRSLSFTDASPVPEEAEVLVLSKPHRGFSRNELARFTETVDAAVDGRFPKARYLVLDFHTAAPDPGCVSPEFNRLAANIETLVSRSPLIAAACVRGRIGGGDLELALACNMLVADGAAEFHFAIEQGSLGLYGSLATKLGYVYAERLMEQGATLTAEQMRDKLLVREILQLSDGLEPLWRFLERTSRRHNSSWAIFRAQRMASPSIYASLQ
jgi:enoyl-CoA hydratase/carnithine racemase